MKKKLPIMIILILLVLSMQNQWGSSKGCSLCNKHPYHEPCIINLSSGEIIPLTVYDPHPNILGELAEEQSTGYASIRHCPNYFGYRDTNIHITTGRIQICSSLPNRRTFCRACRKELRNYAETGFVMADLYHPENPRFFPLEPDTTITLRCYIIDMEFKPAENVYKISVQGTLGCPA